MYILLCYFKSILTLYYWSFLFFSLKTMKTPIPKLHFICSGIPPSPPLTSTKPTELRKINSPWKRQCHMCQDALLVYQTFSRKQSIQVARGRQFQHTCTFKNQIIIPETFSLSRKHRNYDRNHIQSWPEAKLCSQNVSYFIICVVLFSLFPSSGTTPPLPKMSLAPRTFMISLLWPDPNPLWEIILKTHPNKRVKDQHRFEEYQSPCTQRTQCRGQ